MILTSAPCMPKGTYHIGNAISAICTDVIANYCRYVHDDQNIVSISAPWNLHGLPFERMYIDTFNDIDYNGILNLALRHTSNAINEIRTFIKSDYYIEHFDSQEDFVDFCIDCFIKLIEKRFIVKYEGIYCLDINKIVHTIDCSAAFELTTYFPPFTKNSITNHFTTLNGYYPMVKQRAFTVTFNYCGETIRLNPIFQSLVYPIYLIKKYNSNTVDYFISCSGFSMNKWHYLRQLVSLALIKEVPISCIFTHGVVLGKDGKPMSKHSDNAICPSDLCRGTYDYLYIRYVLIRSISIHNITIDLVKCKKEYDSIKQKLQQIYSGMRIYPFSSDKMVHLDHVEKYLYKKKFSVALESFYLFLRHSDFNENGEIEDYDRIKKCFCVFFGEINDEQR